MELVEPLPLHRKLSLGSNSRADHFSSTALFCLQETESSEARVSNILAANHERMQRGSTKTQSFKTSAKVGKNEDEESQPSNIDEELLECVLNTQVLPWKVGSSLFLRHTGKGLDARESPKAAAFAGSPETRLGSVESVVHDYCGTTDDQPRESIHLSDCIQILQLNSSPDSSTEEVQSTRPASAIQMLRDGPDSGGGGAAREEQYDGREGEEEEPAPVLDLSLPELGVKNSAPTRAPLSQFACVSALPPEEFEELRPRLARKFPFELDNFQKQAVLQLEAGNSVFVAAHTSAGKTVVAEYAIALARRSGSRCIYTSPIKALSNQKFHDFREEFGAETVGLLTGDVTVNPDASVLIMTTEILRSMLYRGSEVVKDVQYVVFDEVHYVNDSERGVVWEETIIMLPSKICQVFLSATTPNTTEFCEWVGRTKGRPVYLTETKKRPVPLQHYLVHDDGYYPMMIAEGHFLPAAISAANRVLREKTKPKVPTSENSAIKSQRATEKAAIAMQRRGVSTGKVESTSSLKKPAQASVRRTGAASRSSWLSLFRVLHDAGREAIGPSPEVDFGAAVSAPKYLLRAARRVAKEQRTPYERLPEPLRRQMSQKEYENAEVRLEGENLNESGSLLPAVIFCFSKKGCEEIVDHFSGQDILTAAQKRKAKGVLELVKRRLSSADARLPQVKMVEQRALRGFGVHHGGLLPVLKEAVELLFAAGLVKLLVATETFAMGVNMPARTVVFDGFRKHDGRNFRNLEPGEYTQMAGRAGRRGLDKVGTVLVAAWGEIPGESCMKTLLTGVPSRLVSQFRLSYGMILNLIRTSDLSVEEMMRRSFSEYHTQRFLSGLKLSQRIDEQKRLLAEAEAAMPAEQDLIGRFQPSDAVSLEHQVYKVQQELFRFITLVRKTHPEHVLSSIFSVGRQVWVCPKSCRWKGPPLPAMLLTTPMPRHEVPQGPSHASYLLSPAGHQEELFVWLLVLVPLEAELAEGAVDATLPLVKDGWSEVQGKWCGHNWNILCVTLQDIAVIMRKEFPLSGLSTEPSGLAIKPKPALIIKRSQEKAKKPPFSQPIKPALLQEQNTAALVQQLAEETIAMQGQLASDGAPDMEPCYEFSAEIRLTSLEEVSLGVELASLTQRLLPTLACVYWHQDLREAYRATKNISDLRRSIGALKDASSLQALSMFPDFQQRSAVLERTGCVDSVSKTVLLKGRAACEMNTCNEVLAVELIFANVLQPLNPPEAAGLLAALVCQEKGESPSLTPRMEAARSHSYELLNALSEVEEQAGLQSDEEFNPSLNFAHSAVVYQWARGVPFAEITTMTTSPEGSIVRCISRLDELLKDVRNAARIIGSASLFRQMEAASQCIARDVVFAASLKAS